MKKFGKRLSFLLAILVLISFALPTAMLAEEQETTIVIHKLVMTQDDLGPFAGFTGYDGTAIDPVNYGANVKEVSGVAFRLYKELVLAENDTVPEGAILGSDIPHGGAEVATTNSYYLSITTEASTDGVFQTGEDNLGVTIGGLENGTYIMVEDKEKSTYVDDGAIPADSKAVPAILTLPITNSTGDGYLDVVHLYPKNTIEKPELTKTFGDDLADVLSLTIGDSVPYVVTTTIDKGATYKTLTWTDTMDAGLTFNDDLVIKLGDTILTAEGDSPDYTLTSSDTGFALSLTEAGLAKVATAAALNQVTITLNYSATLNSNAVVEDLQSNTIKLTYGNSTETTYDIKTGDISVTTFGRKFVKVDSNDSANLLAGAQFKVMNEAKDSYLKAIVDENNNFVAWDWTADAADAYILTSAIEDDTTADILELGTFEITGLAEGDYFLVETKAPAGFALPTDPYVAFSVAKGSYEGEGTVALEITNTALSIPQTGGTGTVIFFVSGVAIMALALVGMKLKKSKDIE